MFSFSPLSFLFERDGMRHDFVRCFPSRLALRLKARPQRWLFGKNHSCNLSHILFPLRSHALCLIRSTLSPLHHFQHYCVSFSHFFLLFNSICTVSLLSSYLLFCFSRHRSCGLLRFISCGCAAVCSRVCSGTSIQNELVYARPVWPCYQLPFSRSTFVHAWTRHFSTISDLFGSPTSVHIVHFDFSQSPSH